MSFEVHREPLFQRHYTSLLTSSCCYTIAFGFVLIFLPLILAYNSADFWLKESVINEQPTVNYQYYTIMEFNGRSGDSGLNLFYSSASALNDVYSYKLRVPVLQSAELDDNRDGKTDRLEMTIQMPLGSDEHIYSFKTLVYFKVKFSSKAKYIFDAVSLVGHDSAVSMEQLTVDGDLLLRQSKALSSKGGYRTPYESDALLDLKSLDFHKTNIADIMQESSARTVSMRYQKNYALPEYRTMSAFGSVAGGTTQQYFNATIVVRIPEQPLRYSPEISVVLKQAWIQYVAFFAVVAFLLFRLNSFIFRHQLLATYAVTDIVYEKMD